MHHHIADNQNSFFWLPESDVRVRVSRCSDHMQSAHDLREDVAVVQFAVNRNAF
jgi:hypothetical protein